MKKALCLLILLSMLVFNIFPAVASSGEETGTKMTDALIDAITDLSSEDELTVYLAINDVDYEYVMQQFAEMYPAEYNEYCVAKETDIELETSLH